MARYLQTEFEFAVQFLLFEILFDQTADFDVQIPGIKDEAASRPPIELGDVDAGAIAPYLGSYTDTDAPRMTLAIHASVTGPAQTFDFGPTESASESPG